MDDGKIMLTFASKYDACFAQHKTPLHIRVRIGIFAHQYEH